MTQDGFTALISASWKGNLEVVKALLSAGADKEAKDYVGAIEATGMVAGAKWSMYRDIGQRSHDAHVLI